MQIKFWHRIYLATLLLFLFCFHGGVFALASFSRACAFAALRETMLSRQAYFSQTLATNSMAVANRQQSLLPILYESYGETQLFSLQKGETVQFSNLPMPQQALPPTPEAGTRTDVILSANGQRYFYVLMAADAITDNTLICAFPVEPFFAAWRGTFIKLQMACLFVSIILAIALYWMLQKLTQPLIALNHTAQALAKGDYTARSTMTRTDEIGQLSVYIDTMAAAVEENIASLQEAAAEKQSMIDHLSHELRTPLTAVAGYAEYLQRAQLSQEEQFEATQTIMDEAKRMETMANNLLQIACVRENKIVFAPISLPQLLQKSADVLKPKAQLRGVTLCVSLPPEVKIEGEETLLESVLVNLLDNAVKACEKGGTVTLSATENTIMVQDDGCGMAAQTLVKLGEPFYRADKARARADGGAGIGLSLCFQIIKSHGGTLCFASQLEKGTTATITLKGEHLHETE